jgi:hypothetical protein
MRRILASLLVLLALTLLPVFPAPRAQTSKNQTEQTGNPDVKVWVNTRSGVYHCPGTKWYGATKNGQFMSQKQAQEKGYRPAYSKVCR